MTDEAANPGTPTDLDANCHPERSEGSRSEAAPVYSEIPRCARDDNCSFSRRHLGAPLLFLILAAAILWPYRADDLSPGSLRDIINPIVQAEKAISEGQFPIRVAP